MLLTVSKRLEFSASRRLFNPGWSDAENLVAFGPESAARYGTGRNYVAYFVFTGEVDATNGMLVNISEIKARIERVLHARFDHKFLNEDHPHFRDVPPTAENVARQLFAEVEPLFHRSRSATGRLPSCRDAGTKRDDLCRRLERSKLLARVLRRAANDVAASERD